MTTQLLQGEPGRIVKARLQCNDDLVLGIEDICAHYKMDHVLVKGGLGSLFRAQLLVNEPGDENAAPIDITGYAVELLTLRGEVTHNGSQPEAKLFGMVADNQGVVYSGRFVRAEAPVCITVELVLQEWLSHEREALYR
ncbi:PPC domain-containing DNA-binding protein [Paenalcaligenes sp. Me131]|uniref:PPC domain-containing DNA-binding protein n=1 Tax=Paenalcaligenes sp. Me131 TaxID=3392636 RepID=UPI003D27CD3C